MGLFLGKQINKEAGKQTIYIAPELTNELGCLIALEPVTNNSNVWN